MQRDAPGGPGPVERAARRELAAARRTQTWQGQALLVLARAIDDLGGEPGGDVVTLCRELGRAHERALGGVPQLPGPARLARLGVADLAARRRGQGSGN